MMRPGQSPTGTRTGCGLLTSRRFGPAASCALSAMRVSKFDGFTGHPRRKPVEASPFGPRAKGIARYGRTFTYWRNMPIQERVFVPGVSKSGDTACAVSQ